MIFSEVCVCKFGIQQLFSAQLLNINLIKNKDLITNEFLHCTGILVFDFELFMGGQ